MKENIIQTKSFQFSLKVIELYKDLVKSNEFVLSKQLLRSATSIGANVYEAQGGISKKDFISKIQISYKESLETLYWLKLLYESDYIREDKYVELFNACEVLKKILSSIQKSSKRE